MPNYYNPYSFYPVGYANQMGYAGGMQNSPMMPAQSFAPQGPKIASMWISDEMEARGQQIPQGYQQLAMWDTGNQVIYLKSLNPMGMPNPMQVLDYTFREMKANLPAGQSGNTAPAEQIAVPDMSQYVTRNEMEQMKEELKNVLSSQQNGGYSGNVQNLNYSGNSGGNPNRGGLEGYRISGNDNQSNQNGSGNSMNRGGQ